MDADNDSPLREDILLKQWPVLNVNPNLSRDELGLIFTYYRADLEKMLADAPVQCRGGTVPNDIAIHVLKKQVEILVCSHHGCKVAQAVTNHGKNCECRDNCNIVRTCDGLCGQWMCSKHMHAFETMRATYYICVNCAPRSVCPQCYDHGTECTFQSSKVNAVTLNHAHVNTFLCNGSN